MPTVDPICVAYAPIVSWVVELLKRMPFVAKYPKLLALFLSFAIPALQGVASPSHAFPLTQIITCALVVFGGSIATHEAITDPVRNLFGSGPH